MIVKTSRSLAVPWIIKDFTQFYNNLEGNRMIDHIKHYDSYLDKAHWAKDISGKINEVIRVSNEMSLTLNKLHDDVRNLKPLTPAKRRKLARLEKLRAEVNQLEMELSK